MKEIKSFKGEYAFLSNMASVPIRYMLLNFTCTEAAYNAAKCDDLKDQQQFVGLNGYQAKKLGRTIRLRSGWHEAKLKVMHDLLWLKFTQQPFKSQLLATGDAILIEGNYWHDNFWGSCTCPRCNNQGANNLGKLLMQIRETLKENN